MLDYVNLFTCASDNKDTFVVHFMQNEPVVRPDKEEMEDTIHDVASIVMNKEGLSTLYALVQGMLDNCED